MKRLIITLSLLAAWTASQAQVGEPRQDLAVGVSGGYVLNKVSFNPTIKQDFHTGTTFGITLRYTCEKYFAALCAVQAEVNYTGMGWKEKIETSSDTYERRINYIQVPLLANLGFGRERGGAKGFLILGPQIGFALNEKEKKGGEWSEETLKKRPNQVTQQYDLKVQRKFEYGLTGGGSGTGREHAQRTPLPARGTLLLCSERHLQELQEGSIRPQRQWCHHRQSLLPL